MYNTFVCKVLFKGAVNLGQEAHSVGNITMLLFILTSLFGAGLGLTIKEITTPIKNLKFVSLTLFTNFVLIPALAYTISILLKADPSLQVGLLVIACCAGEPLLPKFMTITKGSVALAIGMMSLLMVTTIAYVPIVLPLIIPGISVNPWDIAKPLIFVMLIPLSLGLLLKAIKSNIAVILHPIMEKASSVFLLITGISLLFTNNSVLTSAWGTGVYNATVLFSICTITIGYFLGGKDRLEKLALSFGTGARNIAAALLIAATNFTDQRVVTVVMIASIMQFIILFSSALLFRKFLSPQSK